MCCRLCPNGRAACWATHREFGGQDPRASLLTQRSQPSHSSDAQQGQLPISVSREREADFRLRGCVEPDESRVILFSTEQGGRPGSCSQSMRAWSITIATWVGGP